ncbi:MAG: hypothetical protein HYY91_00740 [Candidatus Omnitrophica bacterium]|nr:hypothetical protein [Candidatus Omnitrophota bacterium]
MRGAWWRNPVDVLCLVGLAGAMGAVAAWCQLLSPPLPRPVSVEPASAVETADVQLVVRGDALGAARIVIVGGRLLPPPVTVSPTTLTVRFQPSVYGLEPGQHEVRVLNGWGRGGRVPHAFEVMPSPRPAKSAGALSSLSQVPSPLAFAKQETVWVAVRGWIRARSTSAMRMLKPGDSEYDAEGRPLATLLSVAPLEDAVAERAGSSPAPPPHHLLIALGPSASLETKVPGRWYCREVTLALRVRRWGEQYFYQGAPVRAETVAPFTTLRYRAVVRLLDGGRPLHTAPGTFE